MVARLNALIQSVLIKSADSHKIARLRGEVVEKSFLVRYERPDAACS